MKKYSEQQLPDTSGTSEAELHLTHQLEEAEALVHEFRKLLVRHETSLDSEGVRDHLEKLERWAESYRHGLEAAEKISEKGPVWLRDAQERLKLAADELQRMDAESPATGPEEEQARAESFLRAKRRLEALVPAVEQAVPAAINPPSDTKEKELDHAI